MQKGKLAPQENHQAFVRIRDATNIGSDVANSLGRLALRDSRTVGVTVMPLEHGELGAHAHASKL